MDAVSFKTTYLNKETVTKEWVVVDAKGKALGRLASEVAKIIRGKHKPGFTPNVDCGDNVIVVNSDELVLTGSKWTDKEYLSHSGYPGGQKSVTPRELKERKSSTFIVEKAVKGMLPKNRLGRQLFKNLYVYENTEHPHEAQKPKEIKF